MAGIFEKRIRRTERKRISPRATNLVTARSVLGSPEKRKVPSKIILWDLADGGIHVSSRTVLRHLQEAGLNSEIAKNESVSTKTKHTKTIDLGKKHEHRKLEGCEKALWSDEALFQILGGKNNYHV